VIVPASCHHSLCFSLRDRVATPAIQKNGTVRVTKAPRNWNGVGITVPLPKRIWIFICKSRVLVQYHKTNIHLWWIWWPHSKAVGDKWKLCKYACHAGYFVRSRGV